MDTSARSRASRSIVIVAAFALLLPAAASARAQSGTVTPSAADDNIPGVSLPASPFTDSVSWSDERDVFSIVLAQNHSFAATLTGGPPTAFALRLHGPGTTDVEVADPVESAPYDGSPLALEYAVPAGKGGTYYLEVERFSSGGTYTIDYRITPIGRIALSPRSVDFGRMKVGRSAVRTVSVRSVGPAPLTVSKARITGWGRAEYSIVSDGVSGRTLAPGTARNVLVRFRPKRRLRGTPDLRRHSAGSQVRLKYHYNVYGFLSGMTVYSYAQNVRGAGTVRYRVSVNGSPLTKSAFVTAGDRYRLETYIACREQWGDKVTWSARMPAAFRDAVQVTNVMRDGGWKSTLRREPDAQLEIVSNDGGTPTTSRVPLYGTGW